MKTITVRYVTIDDLIARGLSYFARDLKSRGFAGVVTLESDLAASQAYITPRGRIEYVSGSRALVERYIREGKVTPRQYHPMTGHYGPDGVGR